VKTQIIHLDPHDDLASVLDKLNWAKAERLVLVWPGRNRVLTEKLDLRLIQRSALRHNAQVGLVTLDPDVQTHAASLNIPVFEDLDTLHKQRWPEAPRVMEDLDQRDEEAPDLKDLRSKLPGRPGANLPASLRITIFSLAVIVLLLAVAALIPSAEIIVDPELQEYKETFTLQGRATTDSDSSEYLRVDRIRVEGSLRIPTTGVSSEPEEAAHGIVEFTNLGDEAVNIPAGTTVRVPGSEQVYFITQARVRLPAENGSSRSVEIIASSPGPVGNVSANRITAVDGPLGLLVSVNNPEATTGGSIIVRSSVSPSDQDRASAQLTEQLLDQAQELMLANLLPSEQILPESLALDEVLSEEFDRPVGETTDTLELQMSVIASLSIVDVDQLRSNFVEAMTEDADVDVRIVPGSLQIESMSYDDDPDQGTNLEIRASYEAYKPVRSFELAEEIKGMRPAPAMDNLTAEYPRDHFTIELRPGWYPLLPFFPSQIDFRYQWEANS
jgi:hypothetical protein